MTVAGFVFVSVFLILICSSSLFERKNPLVEVGEGIRDYEQVRWMEMRKKS